MNENISNFDSFPEEIQLVLDKYINISDTRLCKSKNVKPMSLNVREGSIPSACFSCRPTPAHYRDTGLMLVKDFLDQKIIAYSRDSRRKWCAPANFIKKPGRVPPTLCLDVDFTHLKDCLIRNQSYVFPTG